MQTLPGHYHEALYFRLTEPRKLLILNLVAVPLLLLAVFFFLGLLILYESIGAPLVIPAIPETTSVTLGLVMVIGVLGLHEWVHGLAIRYYGAKPRYGAKPLRLVLYATADGAYFTRDQYIRIALAPLVVISLLAILISTFVPNSVALWVMMAAATNATGAIGDMWAVWIVRRFPATALIQDEADAIRIFVEG